MTTKRLAVLLAIVLAGLSSAFLLPKQLGYQPVGLSLKLPSYLGRFSGFDLKVSQEEIDALGSDTGFARKLYTAPRGDSVMVSIVLAGQDMMTSLHRPERCLQAQGWNPADSSDRSIAVPNLGSLPVTRMRNYRKVQQPDGSLVTVENVCYYWFIGATKMIGTHGGRVWQDSVDRVMKGYNQRWAMLLVAGEITDGLIPNGRTEEETDRALEDVIRMLLPKIVKEGFGSASPALSSR